MNRYLMLIFGIASYAIGLGGLTCFMLFVGGWPFLPIHIDSKTPGPLGIAVAINLGLMLLFGLSHTVMARPGFKLFWTKIIPPAAERSTYVLVSGVMMIAFCLGWQTLEGVVWTVENANLKAALIALQLFGWGLAVSATFVINHFDLFGLQQVYLHYHDRSEPAPHFIEQSLYKIVRHPLQLGILIGIWSTPVMSMTHLMLSATMTIYILIGLKFEERDLAATLGPEYEEYRTRVRMLWPIPQGRKRVVDLAMIAVVLHFALGSGLNVAHAATHHWNASGGGVYGTITKWTPAGIPGPLDTALFNTGSGNIVDINFLQSRAVAQLNMDLGDFRFTTRGISVNSDRSYTVGDAIVRPDAHLLLERTTSAFDLNFEVTNLLTVQGDLSIRDSTRVTSSVGVVDRGAQAGVANVFVSGANPSSDPSRWDVTDLTVGLDGRGELHVEDGAILSSTDSMLGANSDSFGEIIVRGAGADGGPSMWAATERVVLGDFGDGTLRVEGGAAVSTTPLGAILGRRPGSTGIATLNGVDAAGNPSHWNAGLLAIQGGFIEVTDGAMLTSEDTTFGLNRPGRISVQGVDQAGNPSTWISNVTGGDFFNRLTIGDNSAGILEILNGGRVISNGPTILGRIGEGRVTLSSNTAEALSTWTSSGDVFVGGSQSGGGGTGSILVGNHSRIDVTGTIKVWATGNVSIIGNGTLVADRIENLEGGEFDFSSGQLQTNRFVGDLLNEAGTLTPGGSNAGATQIIGDYIQQVGATLAIDIGGTTAGVNYDLVNLLGGALFNGQLSLTLIDGFTPNASHEFTILAASNLLDSFDNVQSGQRLTTTTGDGSFIVNYGIGSAFDESRIILSDFEASGIIFGDYNGNGTVDAADYTVWRDNLGGSVVLPGDATPGSVTQADYLVWKNNFGGVASTLASSRAVPEPATGCLLALALGLVAISRRRTMSIHGGPSVSVIRQFPRTSLAIALMLTGITTSLQAQITRTWTPQGFSRDWHDAANWSPQGVPNGLDDVIHDNGLRPISLVNGPSSGVDNLILTTGARLFTKGNTLTVNDVGNSGLMEIIGSGSELIVEPRNTSGTSAHVDSLEVKVGGNLNMAGGTIRFDRTLFIDSSSRISGHGILQFDDQDVINPPTVLTVEGTVRASGGVLRIKTEPNSKVLFNNANLDANFGDLNFNATLSESYRGVVTVGVGNYFSSDQEFRFDDTATLNLFGGSVSEPAVIISPLTSIGARVNVNGSAVMFGETRLTKNAKVYLPDPDDQLRLQGTAVIMGDIIDAVETGATFTGTGQLVNETTNGLILLDKPIIDVPFVNSGPMNLAFIPFFAVSEVSFVEFDSFRQTETGLMMYDIGILDSTVFGDSYSVATTAELNGALEVRLVDNLNAGLPTLAVGDNFKIVAAVEGIAGQFSSTTFPTPPADTSWRLNYNTTSVILELVANTMLAGDYNNDGIVDAADYTVWRDNLGSSTPLTNDSGLGGTVDQAHYDLWEANFGSIASTFTSSRTVPEPATGLLLMLGLPVIFRRNTVES